MVMFVELWDKRNMEIFKKYKYLFQILILYAKTEKGKPTYSHKDSNEW